MKLTLGMLLLLAGASSAGADDWAKAADPIENKARQDFSNRMGALNKKGDWKGLLENGREWQKSHPTDPNGWWTEAWGSYNLGDVDTAIVAWKRGDEMEPPKKEEPNTLLEKAQKVRANFPTLQLKPLEFVEGDAAREQREWNAKGAALLAAKSYDEIEKTAQDLQKSNASNTKGTAYLSFFFEGLRGGEGTLSQRQSRVAAWLAARPKSDLARIASVELWTEEAWEVRGDGFADTITQEKREKMGELLQKGFSNMKAWPKTVYDSPLAFDAAINWGQLAGAPADFINTMFSQGLKSFPAYLPLYKERTRLLMTRWFGEAGDMEKFVEDHANTLGGDEGDIFYARMVWTQLPYYSDIWKETVFSYERFKRGMQLLAKQFPDSVSVANTLLRGATGKGDDETAKAFFASPNGHLLDTVWWSDEQRVSFPSWRMNYLAK